MTSASLPATESLDPRSEALETWPLATLLRHLWEGQLAAVAALGPALPALTDAAEAAAARLAAHPDGRLVYVGAGSSARLAVGDGAELGPTYDWPDERLLLLPAGGPDALLRAKEGAEDDDTASAALIAHHRLGPADILVAVAASGTTRYTRAATRSARAAGALTIALANSPNAPLLTDADHPILLATGPEPVAGSTRLGAGTAQKAALNLLSTAIMVRLGRTNRGRMVELRVTNAKLRARAVRLVAELAGISEAQATTALEHAAWRPKVALRLLDGHDLATSPPAA